MAVTLSRDQVEPGQSVEVTVEIDVPVAPPRHRARQYVPGEEPIFDTRLSYSGAYPGEPKAGAINGGEWLYPATSFRAFAQFDDRTQSWRARSTARFIWPILPQAAGGEVVIAIEGGQRGALGSHSGGADRFSGSARLFIKSTRGGGVRPPAIKPPASKTAAADNPAKDIVSIIAVIGIVLAGAGWAWKNSRKRRSPTQPPATPTAPTAPTTTRPQPRDESRQQPDCTISLRYRDRKYLGNAQDCIEVEVAALPTAGWQASIVAPSVKLTANRSGGYKPFTLDIGTVWDRPAPPASPGSDYKYFKVPIPWEWQDVTVTVALLHVTVELMRVDDPSPVARTISLKQPIQQTLTVFGADPKVIVTPDPQIIHATGQSTSRLTPQLWLFHEPAPEETVVVSNATGAINGTPWGQSAKASWTAPFLIQDFDASHHMPLAEEVPLTVQCAWTGGPLYDRASAQRDSPIEAQPCNVTVIGCTIQCRSETEFFVPLPDTPLYVNARITDARGVGVNPHAYANVSRGKVAVGYQVRDLSQAPRGKDSRGCTRPPSVQFDAGHSSPSPEVVRTAVAQAPLVRESDSIEVDSGGWLYTEYHAEPNAPVVVVQEESGPPGPHTQRIDRGAARFMLWRYRLNPGHDPIHAGPVVYTVSIDDGFGGRVEVQGICRVALGSLVFETGGPDFRIYEYRPYSFEVEYRPGAHGYQPSIQDNTKVSLSWEFAYVNDQGAPLASMESVQTPGDVAAGRFNLLVGHTMSERDIYVNRKDGEVAYRRRDGTDTRAEFPAIEWRRFEDSDRNRSFALRSHWHDMAYREEDALRWLPVQGAGTRQPRPWRDRTLAMAMRIEMRTPEGYLVATSDRWAEDENGPRTRPEFVWRDHRFKYVLLAFRLILLDEWDQAYAMRRYRMDLGNTQVSAGTTDEHGAIEVWPAVGCERGVLELYASEQDRDPHCRFKLNLGYLDPALEVSGAQARLNNLGLHAGRNADGRAVDSYQRALQRFQTLHGLSADGILDDTTVRTLESVHALGPG